MTRTQVLRLGHAAVGLTFLALAATFVPAGAALLVLGLLLGFVGGLLFIFSDDELPRWAGLVIVGYFALCLLAFVASTGATIRINGEQWFVNRAPPAFMDAVFDHLVLGLPLLFVAAASVAVWELELPRWIMAGALAGFVLVAILTVALNPTLEGEFVREGPSRLLAPLFSLAALAGAVAAFWASYEADAA